MKKSKKIAAILATIALVSTSAISTFAAPVDDPTSLNVTDSEIKGTVSAPVIKYDVTIDWTGLETFAYNWGTWNGTSYDGGGWTSTSAAVDVTNKSNADLKYALDFAAGAGYTGVTAEFSAKSGTLKNADGNNTDLSANSTITLKGQPDARAAVSTAAKLGSITLSFTK